MKIRCMGLGGQGRGFGRSGPFEGDPASMFFIFFPFLFFLIFYVSSFLLSYISFKKVSLLASVSEFNCRCFLGSRCVLTTWSGIAEIGFGHLVWRQHESTPQSVMGASRLL